jgi:hypothetical protein
MKVLLYALCRPRGGDIYHQRELSTGLQPDSGTQGLSAKLAPVAPLTLLAAHIMKDDHGLVLCDGQITTKCKLNKATHREDARRCAADQAFSLASRVSSLRTTAACQYNGALSELFS